MSRLTDTSPEAERVLTEVYRKMSPGEKWLRLGAMYLDARLLHAAGVRLRNPHATNRDIHEAWMMENLGFARKELIQEPPMGPVASSLQEFRSFVTIFDRLGLAYVLGGSMASSIHGIDRHTRDADVTMEPFSGREAEFAASFGPDYYMNLPAIRDAMRQRSSFNIINTRTGFKVDVFIRKDEPFDQSVMKRRISMTLPDAPQQPIILQSPEDLVLFKLRWYRLGNETSDQQWKDILGVLRVQGDRLDQHYLNHWAATIGVDDLLQRARQESGS